MVVSNTVVSRLRGVCRHDRLRVLLPTGAALRLPRCCVLSFSPTLGTCPLARLETSRFSAYYWLELTELVELWITCTDLYFAGWISFVIGLRGYRDRKGHHNLQKGISVALASLPQEVHALPNHVAGYDITRPVAHRDVTRLQGCFR